MLCTTFADFGEVGSRLLSSKCKDGESNEEDEQNNSPDHECRVDAGVAIDGILFSS